MIDPHLPCAPLSVEALLGMAGLVPGGAVSWRTPIEHHCPGVYVIAVAHGSQIDVAALPVDVQPRWLVGQPVVYIGRTRGTLRRRLGEFYRHKHGNRSPHRGGQDILLLPEERLEVFCVPTDDFVSIEARLIEAFKAHTGRLPFANRKHGTRKPKA